jgi:hypothetical protein
VILNRRSERRWRLLAQYALLELAEAAQGAMVVLLGIVDTESDGSDQAADPSRVMSVLDSPDRAPAFKRKIEAKSSPIRTGEMTCGNARTHA